MGWEWFEALTACLPSHGLGSLTPGCQERPDAGDFREEPGSGKPPARICEGEAEWPSYSTVTQPEPNPAPDGPGVKLSHYRQPGSIASSRRPASPAQGSTD